MSKPGLCVYVWEELACMAQWLIKVMGSLAILNLIEPDPYAGGEGLVTCYNIMRSCSAGMQ